MHYFTNSPDLKHERASVSVERGGRVYTFDTDAGVFSRDGLDPGSALLIDSVGPLSGPCADLGCGWGPIGILLAAANPDAHFYLVDVNERAVALACRNIAQNRIANACAQVGDGLGGVPDGLCAVVSNPPIRIGKQPMYALLRGAYEKLGPGGVLYIVIRKQQGAPSAKAFLEALFGQCDTIARAGGYHILKSQKST